MIPVVTPAEMAAVDRAAPEPADVLVARAGWAVAVAALDMMGGGYGRRVVVMAGKGNNGADGRYAAGCLARRGVRVTVVDAAETGAAGVGPAGLELRGVDLVVDAAYGTGFRGEYQAPDAEGRPVLAVDIPSGVAGLTGAAGPGAVRADRTVTFAALKPGLVFPPGRALAGAVDVVDIGLDVSSATVHVVEHEDVDGWVPRRPVDTHKWKSAVWVVAGSSGRTGAASLAARAAMRAGAGIVRLGIPGVDTPPPFLELVGRAIPSDGWDDDVLADLGRAQALVVGPGLGRAAATGAAVRRLVSAAPVPTVIDADGLYALGTADEAVAVLRGRAAPTVLTPHDGEYTRLAGQSPGDDRVAAARHLAAQTRATVLLKGPTTVVADPSGRALLSTAGDERLATAGTGDVLAGVIGAYLAQGLDGLHAGAAAAFVHGRAGHLGWRHGLVAGDLLDLLPAVLDRRP